MTECLLRLSPDRVEWVQVTAGDMALCSQARHSASFHPGIEMATANYLSNE